LKNFVNSFSLSTLSPESFFSKKKEKKKAQFSVAVRPGRAISPAGWFDGLPQASNHYALVRAGATTFAALFFVFLKKASAIEFKIFKQ